MSNKADAHWIANALDLAASMCQNIEEADACRACPLFAACIDANNLTDIAFTITADEWNDFLDFADDLDDFIAEREMDSEDNQRALYEDFRRQMDIEERMIDEECGL